MHRKQRDDAPGLSSRNVLLAVAVSLALAAPASADVTLRERTVSTGLAGSGNGTGERTIVIAGEKSRSKVHGLDADNPIVAAAPHDRSAAD